MKHLKCLVVCLTLCFFIKYSDSNILYSVFNKKDINLEPDEDIQPFYHYNGESFIWDMKAGLENERLNRRRRHLKLPTERIPDKFLRRLGNGHQGMEQLNKDAFLHQVMIKLHEKMDNPEIHKRTLTNKILSNYNGLEEDSSEEIYEPKEIKTNSLSLASNEESDSEEDSSDESEELDVDD